MSQPRSGHLMDAHGADLVSWFCWWFSKACWRWSWTQDCIRSDAQAGTESSWRSGCRVRRVAALSASGEASSAGLGPHSSFMLGVFPPTCQSCCGRGQGQRLTAVCGRSCVGLLSPAHSWSMVPVLEASSSCGGKNPSQGLPRVLAAEA